MSSVIRLRTRAAPVVSVPAPNISALAKQHGVSRQTIRRRLKNGWDPSIKIIERDQGLATHGHPVGHPPGHHALHRVHVDLIALKRDLQEWAELHRNVDRTKARQWRGHLSDQLCRFGFLIAGVAAFALFAFAALN
jgi:hypothetical protein